MFSARIYFHTGLNDFSFKFGSVMSAVVLQDFSKISSVVFFFTSSFITCSCFCS